MALNQEYEMHYTDKVPCNFLVTFHFNFLDSETSTNRSSFALQGWSDDCCISASAMQSSRGLPSHSFGVLALISRILRDLVSATQYLTIVYVVKYQLSLIRKGWWMDTINPKQLSISWMAFTVIVTQALRRFLKWICNRLFNGTWIHGCFASRDYCHHNHLMTKCWLQWLGPLLLPGIWCFSYEESIPASFSCEEWSVFLSV